MKKLSLSQLHAQINDEQWPEISTLNYSDDGLTLNLDIHIPEHLSWFAGHFPEQPVLPGVVQLDWAGQLAEWAFTIENDFQRVDNLKFNNMVLPLTTLSLTLTRKTDTSIAFSYHHGDTTYSSGKLVFDA